MSEGAVSAVQVSSSGDLNCKVTVAVAVADGDESEQFTAGLLSGHGDWGEGCGKEKDDSPGHSFPTSPLPCSFISSITQRGVGVLDLEFCAEHQEVSGHCYGACALRINTQLSIL